MFYLFHIYLLIVLVFAEEDQFNENSNSTDNTIIATDNFTDNFQNVTMERIVTPSDSLILNNNPSDLKQNGFVLNITKDRRDFRPSPQVGSYYDFPISPSHLPEPKHSSSSDFDNSWRDNIKLTTESNWGSTRIKFPTQKPEVATPNDHPYPFVRDEPISEKNGGVTSYEYISVTNNNNEPKRTYYEFPNSGYEAQRPHLNGVGYSNFGLHGKSGFLDSIPWNKVVKFLTTAIPIGLVIGALTPNVINVSSVNAS